MKTKKIALAGMAALGTITSCAGEMMDYTGGDLRVCVREGVEWVHDFPLFLGIKKKNPPQIAVWAEDTEGRYLSTLYVSHRTATGKWIGGTARPEALPAWSHARGVQSVDGASGATPKAGFDVKMRPTDGLRRFVVKIEVNHSRDWNGAWPEGSTPGASNFNAESGQPALVYAATIDLDAPQTSYTATLVGHSSPDGTDGDIRPDTSNFTTALNIVKEITIDLQ